MSLFQYTSYGIQQIERRTNLGKLGRRLFSLLILKRFSHVVSVHVFHRPHLLYGSTKYRKSYTKPLPIRHSKTSNLSLIWPLLSSLLLSYLVRSLAAPFGTQVHHGSFGGRRINGAVQLLAPLLFTLMTARLRQRRLAGRADVRGKIDGAMRQALIIESTHLVDSEGERGKNVASPKTSPALSAQCFRALQFPVFCLLLRLLP